MEVSIINPDGNNYTLKDTVARTRIAEIEQGKGSLSEERKTDYKWTDGKDIYARGFEFTVSVSANGSVTRVTDINKAEVDKIIKMDAGLRASSNYFTSGNDTAARTTIGESGNFLSVTFTSSAARSNATLFIIIYYTKK